MAEPSVRLRSHLLLAEAMKVKNLSYRDMAQRLPCGKSMVGALATGKKKTCRAELGERIAEAVGLDFELLFVVAPSIHRGRPSRKAEAA